MADTLDGANTTAQWYQDDYPGTLFPSLEKFVLHTTETLSWPGYSGGASAPNATYHPRRREIRQHFSNNRSARALRDPSATSVRENRDRVFQLEIVAYSDKALGDTVNGLWIGDLADAHYTDLARMMIQLNRELGLPLREAVTWKEGATGYYGGVRLSGPMYDAYRGILGHIHVSGNSHWDPGGFRASRLMAKITELTAEPPPTTEEEPTMSSWDEVVDDRALKEFTKGADDDSTRDELLMYARYDAWRAHEEVKALRTLIEQRLPAPPA